jgi:predicted nucleotidyltransferase
MPPDLPPLVQRTLGRLIRAFAPERIVLFGSHAKGTVHGGSDVNLLIIANLEGGPAGDLTQSSPGKVEEHNVRTLLHAL